MKKDEANNSYDTHVIAVKRLQAVPGKPSGKWEEVIGGHMHLTMLRVVHLFLKKGGKIYITVARKRRNKGISLEITATYTFYHKKNHLTVADQATRTIKRQGGQA